jgi:type IV pilus assembly protein PilW
MNIPTKIFTRAVHPSRGFTIVELLVAVTIASVLIAIASAVYLNSSKSYRALDEAGRIDEAGRLALKVITTNLQQAGFTLLTRPLKVGQIAAEPPGVAALEVAPLNGCRFGYLAPGSDWSCKASGNASDSDAFSVAFDVDIASPGTTVSEGVTCSGAKINALANTPRQAWNHFYIAPTTFKVDGQTRTVNQLMCAGRDVNNQSNVFGGVQPLFSGIEQLTLSYGVAVSGSEVPTQFVDANNLVTEDDWKTVTAVRVCILVKSELMNVSLNTAGTVRDCRGATITNTSGYAYKTLTSVVALRNRITTSLDANI